MLRRGLASQVWQGLAGRGKAWLGMAGGASYGMAWRVTVWQGRAWMGMARLAMVVARFGMAGKARQGIVW